MHALSICRWRKSLGAKAAQGKLSTTDGTVLVGCCRSRTSSVAGHADGVVYDGGRFGLVPDVALSSLERRRDRPLTPQNTPGKETPGDAHQVLTGSKNPFG